MKNLEIPIYVNNDEKTTDEPAMASLYLPDNFEIIDENRKRPTIIILPGGSYKFAADCEGEPIALRLMGYDFNAVVLKYSCAPNRFPTAIFEVAKLIMILRKKADEWNVDVNKIIVCGFSAGGHLAASYCTLWNRDFVKNFFNIKSKENKPNAMLLGYPVIDDKYIDSISIKNLLGERYNEAEMLDLVSCQKQVDGDTPPAFIWHTAEDFVVKPQNSLVMTSALLEKGVPVEYHLFRHGNHGMGLVNEITMKNYDGSFSEVQVWIDLAIRWIKNL